MRTSSAMATAGQEIVNPATGERVVFRRVAKDTGGTVLELDDVWTRPGHLAPLHAHPGMEERWTVLAGTARFSIDGQEHTITAGETIVAPAGVPHSAWNPTNEPVRLRIEMRPALRWERFVEELFALNAEAVAGGRRGADRTALTALLARYPEEIATTLPGAAAPVSPSEAHG